MPEYLSPGVYIEEIEIGAKPIEGVSTSTTAFIGGAKTGPILEPSLVTSWSQFESKFGGLISSPRIYLGYAVDAFFRNGGKRAYIVRVASSTASKADYTIQNRDGNDAIPVESLEVGADANNIRITTSDGSISGSLTVFKKEVNVTSISGRDITVADSSDFEVGDRLQIEDGTNSENAAIRTIAGNVITLEGDLVNSYTAPITLRTADIASGDKEIRLTDTSKIFTGTIIHITDGTNNDYGIAEKISGKKVEIKLGVTHTYGLDSGDPDVTAGSMEFNMTLTKGSISESFTELSIDPRHPRFFKRIITSSLASVKLCDPPATAASAQNLLPAVLNNQSLSGGVDDDLSAIDYTNGLTPLEKVEGISLLAIPGQTSRTYQQAIIDHCEKMRYRFAILDSEYGAEPTGTSSVKDQRDNLGSKKGFGALYYPWVQITDPVSKELIYLPPSGAAAGVYARSDVQRGVHKAPANEKVAGVIGLERVVTKGEQEILNPGGVNVIRSFRGRGVLIWGARTIASDPLWKYVNVRRLFLFLEESIEKATQWVVFEPNNEKLWARVMASITEFLTKVWKDGALMGTKAEEAFFVKCDRTTMTQNDIDNGRLICIIGVSPTKPAEFVIFRIAQWTGGSSVTE
jgi:phage tail sheath protein FI